MPTVAIINPHEPHFDRLSTLFVMPRYGTIAIGTALKNAGYEVRVFCEYIRGEVDWDFVRRADYVCVALMTFCAARGYEVAQELRRVTRAPIIFGGAHPTVLPEECLEYCDYAVRGEGEATLLELLARLSAGAPVTDVAGLSYRDPSRGFVHNPRREFMEEIDVPQDVEVLDGYGTSRERFSGRIPAMHLQVVQTSRGCPFNCKFCVAPQELGLRYRTKSNETVLRDIANSMATTGSRTFMLVDNELTVNRKRVVGLLQSIIDRYGDTLDLVVFARTEVGQEPEILALMKRAGVKILFVGVESVSDETLRFFSKKQTLESVRRNVANIHAAGIHTMGSTILGTDHDTPDSIRNTADFFIENDFYHAHFYSFYEIPTKQRILGLPQLLPDTRFVHHDWRFYNSAYVIHYPKNMKPSTLQRIIIANYEKFYALHRKAADPLKGTAYGRTAMKLFMINPELKLARQYIPFLEEMEDGLYDERERLIEDRLPPEGAALSFRRHIPIDLSLVDDLIDERRAARLKARPAAPQAAPDPGPGQPQ
ncbi:MAG: B12-binding domain-containing radical SAM protein [Polyangiaceae bacterium]|nr:B12-binding domain-containing radical SAM protein [Polyangiaceae bacterium]